MPLAGYFLVCAACAGAGNISCRVGRATCRAARKLEAARGPLTASGAMQSASTMLSLRGVGLLPSECAGREGTARSAALHPVGTNVQNVLFFPTAVGTGGLGSGVGPSVYQYSASSACLPKSFPCLDRSCTSGNACAVSRRLSRLRWWLKSQRKMYTGLCFCVIGNVH